MAFHRNLKGLDLHNSRIQFYSGNPNGNVEAFAEGEMCINPDSGAVYTATDSGYNNWVAVGGGSFDGTTDDLVNGDNTETFLTSPTKMNFVDGERTDSYTENGTINRPYKTIEDAVVNVSAGSIIFVFPSVYTISSQIYLNDIAIIGQGCKTEIRGDDGIIPFTVGGTFYMCSMRIYSTNAPAVRTDSTKTGQGIFSQIEFLSTYNQALPGFDYIQGSCPVGSCISLAGDGSSNGLFVEFHNAHFSYNYTGTTSGDQAHCYIYQGEGTNVKTINCNDFGQGDGLSVVATGTDWTYGVISPTIIDNGKSEPEPLFYSLFSYNSFFIGTDDSTSFNGTIVASVYNVGSSDRVEVLGGRYEVSVPSGTPEMYAAMINNQTSGHSHATLTYTEIVLISPDHTNKYIGYANTTNDLLKVANTIAVSRILDTDDYERLTNTNPGSGTVTGSWFDFEGSELINIADVDKTNLADGTVLEWNTSTGYHEYIPYEVDSLNDVDTTSREHGDVLIWDGNNDTYRLQKNNLASAGVIGPHPTLTDNGDGTVNITSSQVAIYGNSSYKDSLEEYIVPETNLSFTDDTLTYVVVKYNAGSPQYELITSLSQINESDVLPIFTFQTSNNVLYELQWEDLADGMGNRLHMRQVKTDRYAIEDGFSLDESSNQHVYISSGTIWYGANRRGLNAFDSSVDTWVSWYHSSGNWIKDFSTDTYNNTQYDDGSNLQSLTDGYWVVNWIYRSANGAEHGGYLLSSQYPTLAEARLARLPDDISPEISELHFVVGRIIVQKGATSGYVEELRKRCFKANTVTDHNDLNNLDTGDYQHLTLTEHDNLTSATPTKNYWQYSPYQWNDLRSPATDVKLPGTNIPNFDNTRLGFLFDPGKTETVFVILQMDHSWAIGTDIVPHIHWLQEETGDVLWQLEYQWTGNGEAPTAWTTLTTTNKEFTYDGTTIGQISSFGEITPPASAGISAIIKCKISRLGGDGADTYGIDALFNEFDIHFQMDYHGSEQEFVK